ncbi:hypothetical protein [Bacillus velezensis]|uniref:hypothetical protein n=1 Tax=Bacillus velezensis TaxID=492670 RepID=UPI001F0F072F|nr:hypothetical protein [Bacillus velezensis]UMU16858.1 hypothetical protein FOV14_19280 [Bacillus velezensis]
MRIRIIGARNTVDACHEVGVKRIIAQSLSFAYEPGLIPANEDVPLDLDAPNPRKINVIGVASLESAVAELPDLVNNIKTLQENGLNNISFEVNHDTLEHLSSVFFYL